MNHLSRRLMAVGRIFLARVVIVGVVSAIGAGLLFDAPVAAASSLAWSYKSPRPGAPLGSGTVASNGRGYQFGGFIPGPPQSISSTTHVYNPTSDTWSAAANMPTGRYNLGEAAGLDGKVYGIGGWLATGWYTGIVEAYDPATGAWTSKAPLPRPRQLPACATGTNGLIYCIGGTNYEPYSGLNQVDAYNPATNSWTTAANMPTGRWHLATVGASNGKIYAIGGYAGGGGALGNGQYVTTGILSTVEEYDPATNIWTTKAPMPTPRVGLTAVATPDGKIYVIGGSNGQNLTTYLATVEVYDTATNTWSTETSLNTPRMLSKAVLIDQVIYVMGGVSAGAYIYTVEAAGVSGTAAPGVPQSFAYAISGNQLSLTWQAVSGATGYTLLVGMAKGIYPTSVPLPAGTTSLGPIGISSIPAGTYYLALKAVAGASSSATSNEIVINWGGTALGVPQSFAYILSNNKLTLNWNAVAGATGYKIGVGAQTGIYSIDVDAGNVITFGPLDVTGVTGTYYLAAKAYNGSLSSAYSSEKAIDFVGTGSGTNVITGPGGISVMLPATASSTSATLTQGTGTGLAASGQQAISVSTKVSLGGGKQTMAGNITVSFPVPAGAIDTNSLFVSVKTTSGDVLPVLGSYDSTSRTYSVPLSGLANGWELQLVAEPGVVFTAPDAVAALSANSFAAVDTNWGDCVFTIVEHPKPGVTVITIDDRDTLHSAIIRSCLDYKWAGFKAPNLPVHSMLRTRILHVTYGAINLNGRFGQAELNPDQLDKRYLGQIYVDNSNLAQNNALGDISGTAAHELFHTVQFGYGPNTKPVSQDTKDSDGKDVSVWMAYAEGTAATVGHTFQVSGTVIGTTPSVYRWPPLLLDQPLDAYSLVNSDAYKRQDFFAYLAKRYGKGSYAYLGSVFENMFQATKDLTPVVEGDAGMATSISNYLTLYRQGVSAGLMSSFKVGLSEAYKWFSMDRAYLHSDYAKLRDENLTENTLDSSVFSGVPEWNMSSATSTTLTDIAPLSTKALRASIGASLKDDLLLGIKKDLSITATISGGDLKEEGVRLIIIPETSAGVLAGDPVIVLTNPQTIMWSAAQLATVDQFSVLALNTHLEQKTAHVGFSVATSKGLSISTISPTSGAVGTVVTITGTGFGTTKGTVTFLPQNSLGNIATVNTWSDTQITATVPTGAQPGVVVVLVTIYGGGQTDAINGKTFTVTVAPPPVAGTCSVSIQKICDDCSPTNEYGLGSVRITPTGGTPVACLGKNAFVANSPPACISTSASFSGTVTIQASGGYGSIFYYWTGSSSSSNQTITLGCGTSSTAYSLVAHYSEWFD